MDTWPKHEGVWYDLRDAASDVAAATDRIAAAVHVEKYQGADAVSETERREMLQEMDAAVARWLEVREQLRWTPQLTP